MFKSPVGNIAAVFTTALIVAVGSGFLLWLILGEPRLSPSKSRPLGTEELYDGIKIALTVVGGIGGVVALVVAYRRQRYAEAESGREDTKLYTERFRTAAEQLGSDKSAIRMAGVYAIANLADDWHAGRQTCIDILCAFLRMPYTPPNEENAAQPSASPEDGQEQRRRREEQQIRRSAIRIIRNHLRDGAAVPWAGHNLDFTGATFDVADFSSTRFSGAYINFGGATFCGGHSSFSSAVFSGGTVSFENAKFVGGDISFRSAKFSGGKVRFVHAEFSGSEINFRGAEFSKSEISFRSANFSGGEVDFDEATLSGGKVDFDGATFSGGKVDFSKARFSGGMTFAAVLDPAPPEVRPPTPVP